MLQFHTHHHGQWWFPHFPILKQIYFRKFSIQSWVTCLLALTTVQLLYIESPEMSRTLTNVLRLLVVHILMAHSHPVPHKQITFKINLPHCSLLTAFSKNYLSNDNMKRNKQKAAHYVIELLWNSIRNKTREF